MSETVLSQNEIMEQWDKMMNSYRYNNNPIYEREVVNKFIETNLKYLRCDGCNGKFHDARFSSIHKGHPSNPLDRRAILHLTGTKRCKIRICINCGNIETNNMKKNCSVCKKPIERNTSESIHDNYAND